MGMVELGVGKALETFGLPASHLATCEQDRSVVLGTTGHMKASECGWGARLYGYR